jgi:predicted phage tail protein
MDYLVKKGLGGKLRVHYVCPGCAVSLNSPLHEAGKPERCPTCNAGFRVPGTAEREADEARLAEEEQNRLAQAKIKEREAARLAADRAAKQAEAERIHAAAMQSQAEARRADNRKIGVSVGGVICIVIGVVVLIIAFGMDTTVRDVHNIGLLNRQLMLFILGAVLLLIGFILDAANSIVINIRDTDRNQNQN